MQKQLVGAARCQASRARYYLLEEELERGYGVEIEMEGESAAFSGLSPSRERVRKLAEALVRGVVTPVTLRDIVEDWLLE